MNKVWIKKPIGERIRWYREKLNELYDYVGDKSSFSQEEKEWSKHLLREIKERSNSDSKFESSRRRMDQLTNEEQEYYRVASTIDMYLPKLNSRQNTWHDGLYDAQYELEYYYGPHGISREM